MFNEKLPKGLTPPGLELQQHSKKLIARIISEIEKNGPMTFARYMQLALYAPGLGYYSAGLRKFGKSGDFITAPELSPLFAKSLAKQCQQILTHLNEGIIFELGAGSGILAAHILLELKKLNCLPAKYYILEVSADLRQRQQATLQNACPDLIDRIQWLDTAPAFSMQGVILANEVLDAMPVHRFHFEKNLMQEFFVAWGNEAFKWHFAKPSSKELAEEISSIQKNYLSEADFYESEINLFIKPWLKTISQQFTKGLILLIDYGFARHEYYHPDRNQGTLMCHYQHRAHSDPLVLPGLQDISTHVDFTTVAEAASICDLNVAGYTTQASFLLSCGILEMLHEYDNETDQWRAKQAIKMLTSPAEMGELFKVIALTRDVDLPLLGFNFQDLRNRL